MEARLDAGSNGEEGPAGETQYVAGNAGHKSSTTLIMDLTLHCNSNNGANE